MDENNIEIAIDKYMLNENKKPEFDSNDDYDITIFKPSIFLDSPPKTYDVSKMNTHNLETTKSLQNNQNYSYSITKTNTIIYDEEKNENFKNENKQKMIGKKRKRKKERDSFNNVDVNKKKNMGRKTKKKEIEREKENKSKKVHDKNSKDNLIYKIKVRFQKFLYVHLNHLLKKKGIKEKFKRINGEFTRNGSKEHNLKLFNMIIKQFLLCDISDKYGTIKISNNILIEKLNSDENFVDLFNMTYNNFLYDYFLMDKKKFKEIFNYENQFLYENIELEKNEKQNWQNIIEFGFIRHFTEISGRSTMTEEAKKKKKDNKSKKIIKEI